MNLRLPGNKPDSSPKPYALSTSTGALHSFDSEHVGCSSFALFEIVQISSLPSATSFLIFHVHFQGKIELAFGFGFLDKKRMQKNQGKCNASPLPSKLQERLTKGRVRFCGLSKQFGIHPCAWPAAFSRANALCIPIGRSLSILVGFLDYVLLRY